MIKRLILHLLSKFYRSRVECWVDKLLPQYDGRVIENVETGDTVELKYEEILPGERDHQAASIQEYIDSHGLKSKKILLNGKPVYEAKRRYLLSEYQVNRYNYGSWVWMLREFYKAHEQRKREVARLKHDALFAPLDE